MSFAAPHGNGAGPIQPKRNGAPAATPPVPAENTAAVVELYRNIAASLPHGAVFVVDRDLRYVLADGAGLQAAGFSPGDFEGRLLSETAPPDLREQYLQDYRAILLGVPMTREHAVNGLEFVSHGVPLLDRGGAVVAALVLSYDITERKRAERRLQLFDALGSLVRDSESATLLQEEAARLIENYLGGVRCRIDHLDGSADAVGHVLAAFPGIEDGGAVGACLLRGETVAATGFAHTGPGAAAKAFILLPHVDEGRVAGVTSILSEAARDWSPEERSALREASDRVWCHLMRLRLVDALRAADHQKDRFLAVLAHELRNPLAALRNGLSLLKLAGPGAPPERVVRLMEQQFAHMGRLIEDVLDASYICHGDMALRLQRLSLQDVVQAAAEAAREAVAAKGLELAVCCTEEPCILDGDPTRLAQAVSNVIANAIKYSPAPGMIRVGLERRGPRALVTVADDGIGMSLETRERLFELFVRGRENEIARSEASGLGVGMWVTRQLVQAHGGSIHAGSDGLGKGSTFTIELPLAQETPG